MWNFLRLQLRAMAGIFRRDVLVFIRYPMNALFRFVEPVIWFTPVYFMGQGFSMDGHNAGFAAYTGSGDFMAFIILGAVLSNYISAVFWGIGYSLKNQMDAGVLESNWLTPVPRVTHLIGQTLFSLLITTFNACVVGLLAWLLFGFELSFDKVGPALLIAIPFIIAVYGFGFAFAALVMLMRDANTLVDTGNFLVGMLSGDSFPVKVLPRFLLVISLSLPLTYGFDAFRGLMMGTQTMLPIEQERIILIGFMVVMVFCGTLVFRWLEKRCRQLGTTGLH